MENIVEERNELGNKNITKLFVKYSGLTLVGMIAQAIMVIFEGIIIGNGLGADGLTAVGLIMSLEYLMLALGGFFAIGISSSAALKLGNGDKEGARETFAQGTWLSIIFILALSLLIFIFAPTVANILGTPEKFMVDLVKFIRIFMVGYPFCIIGHIVVYMARVDEKPSIATYAMTSSAIISLAWLYISINILKLGIVGAAGYYASSIGLWGIFLLYFIVSKKTIFKIHISDMKLSKKVLKPIVVIGFPYLLIQAATTVFTIVTNNFLGIYGGPLHIAAFAIINGYIIYILMMITQSASGGLQPIASYNFGAKLYSRIKKLIRVGIVGNIIGVAVISILFGIFAKGINAIFCGDEVALIKLSAKYTRIIVICTSLGLTSFLMSGYFQAVERVKESILLGVCRYILFAIPLMYLLSKLFGIEGVWFSLPVADILSFVLSIILAYKENSRLEKLQTI